MSPSDNESFGYMVRLFCTTTSIRGVARIHRGPLFLRLLWMSFVVIMTAGLIVATTYIVLEYLQYDVNINTKILIDDNSSFPALTICHHHPFSHAALALWSQHRVLSPTRFNQRMRNISLNEFRANNSKLGLLSPYFDTMSIYYQNLAVNDSDAIGHDKDTFLMCVCHFRYAVSFEDDCSKMKSISFRKLPNDEFFNCHTFEPKNIEDSYLIDSLNIVASLDPLPDYGTHEQAFISDTFQRSQGLRVVVHERGSFPDIAQDGLHVEPGKMNEIKYQPIRHEKIDSPSKPCLLDDKGSTFRDLNDDFMMDKKHCISIHKQDLIILRCKCIYVTLPRPVLPTADLPYCGNIPADNNISVTMERINCISDIVNDRSLQKELEQKNCFKRCNFMSYESTVSVTKWGATAWHLHWIRHTNQALNDLKDSVDRNHAYVMGTEAYRRWETYATSPNLTVINNSNNTSGSSSGYGSTMNSHRSYKDQKKDSFLKNDNFAYVVLQRKSKNTIVKQERLVTTMYVLMSRFGGVCSLTIGITAGFVVEFIEFLYRYFSHNYDDHRSSPVATVKIDPGNSNQQQQQQQQQPTNTNDKIKTNRHHWKHKTSQICLAQNATQPTATNKDANTISCHCHCHCQSVNTNLLQDHRQTTSFPKTKISFHPASQNQTTEVLL